MDDLWSAALGLLQLWIFVVVFLIMLPAMFGLSLGVTGVYIKILVKILEVFEFCLSSVWCLSIQRGRPLPSLLHSPTVRKCAAAGAVSEVI